MTLDLTSSVQVIRFIAPCVIFLSAGAYAADPTTMTGVDTTAPSTDTLAPGQVVIGGFDSNEPSSAWDYFRVIGFEDGKVVVRSIEARVAIPDPDYSPVQENANGAIRKVDPDNLVRMRRTDDRVIHRGVVRPVSFRLDNGYHVLWNTKAHVAVPNGDVTLIEGAVYVGSFHKSYRLTPKKEVLIRGDAGFIGPFSYEGAVTGMQDVLVVRDRDGDPFAPESYRIVSARDITHVKIRSESQDDRFARIDDAPDQRPAKVGGVFRELATGRFFLHTGPFDRDGRHIDPRQLVRRSRCTVLNAFGKRIGELL